MFNIAKCCTPRKIKNFVRYRILDGYALKSYSQEGEDMILRRVFEHRSIGFYVDVGAHHPKRFSNTYYFYKRGWSGINIDAMPGSMKLFKRLRPRDINLEIPVGPGLNSLTYFIFNEPALNGFDARLSQQRDSSDNAYNVIKTIDLQTRTLESILDEFLPQNKTIDFLSVDVEGLDLEVLKSNNWKKYKPEYILVEILDSSLSELHSNEINKFMKSHGYKIYAKAVNTVIYKRCVL